MDFTWTCMHISIFKWRMIIYVYLYIIRCTSFTHILLYIYVNVTHTANTLLYYQMHRYKNEYQSVSNSKQ